MEYKEIEDNGVITFQISERFNINIYYIENKILYEKYKKTCDRNILITDIFDTKINETVNFSTNHLGFINVNYTCKLRGIELYNGVNLTINNIDDIKVSQKDNQEIFYYINDLIFTKISNIKSIDYQNGLINDKEYKNKKIIIKIVSKPEIKEYITQDSLTNKKYKGVFLSKLDDE